MNRRAFVAWCALAACRRAPATPVQARRPRPPAPTPPTVPPEIPVEIRTSQTWRRALAVAGDRVVLRTSASLEVWDTGLRPVATIRDTYCAACVLADGRVAAIAAGALHVIDRDGNVEAHAHHLLTCGRDTWIAPAPGGVYLGPARDVVLVFDLANATFTRHPLDAIDPTAHLASLADGRLVAIGLHHLWLMPIGRAHTELAVPDAIVHFAAVADVAWMAVVAPGARDARVVVTMPLAAPTGGLRIDVAPARVWDLAAAPAGVALLLDDDRARTLVMLDPRGRERWRVELAPRADLETYVAVADHRVIVQRGDGGLDTWDVESGAHVAHATRGA